MNCRFSSSGAGSRALVEQHSDILRVDLLHEVAEKSTKAVERVDRVPVRVDHVIRHRVVGPKDINARVDKILHHAAV
jgi:hypothetical protein